MAILSSEKSAFRPLFRSSCLFLLVLIVSCSPPEDPIKCSSNNSACKVTNAFGVFADRSVCKAANATYPTSEKELISIVSKATVAKRKIKVATIFSHSIPKLVCPDGEDGLLISTKFLNRLLNIDFQAKTITVEGGVSLRQIINAAANAGLALPAAPYWWGVTIGGLISTGTHGSSLWGRGSSIHDYVVGLRIVSPGKPEEGYVKVRVLNEKDPDLDAAKVSLGVLGVISQVTLKLQPMFKRSITRVEKSDSDLKDRAVSLGSEHEFADITWYPSQRKVVYRIDDRVPLNTSGNGLNEISGFRTTASLAITDRRTTEEIQEYTGDVQGKCTTANLVKSTLITTAYGFSNDGVTFTGYPIIGFQNRIQSTGTCLDSPEDGLITACSWDPRLKGMYYYNSAISVGLSVVKNFIEDVQKLIDLEPRSLCSVELYGGILTRYVKSSSAFLGKQEDSLEFDFTYYRSRDPLVPRLYEDILEEIEQIAVFKYRGLPHWGKNRNAAFVGAIRKYKNAEQFLKIKEKYDPSGLFSSEWTDQVLGLKDGVTIVKEGCALEGLCICSKDIHCAPQKGYFCRPGRIYKRARVCTTNINLSSI